MGPEGHTPGGRKGSAKSPLALQPLVDSLPHQPGRLPRGQPRASLGAAKVVRADRQRLTRVERLPTFMSGALQARLEAVLGHAGSGEEVTLPNVVSPRGPVKSSGPGESRAAQSLAVAPASRGRGRTRA